MKDFSYITNSHPAYIENLYQSYMQDPGSVDPEMKKFFEGFDFAVISGKASSNGGTTTTSDHASVDTLDWKKEISAYRMILGYRNKGHLIAETNPIRKRKDRGANLDLGFFGFTEEDMDKTFQAGNLIGLGPTSLRNVITHLQKCYAGHVGIEFKYISNQKKVDWITAEIEKKFN